MRRIYLLLLFLIPLSLLAACSSDDEIAIATLEISKTTVDFKSEASEQSLTITTNAVAWTAQSDKSWCRPSIVGKLLKISVDQSDERLVREATVSVTADGLSKTIRVRQLGYEAAILIDQQAFEVPAVGAQIKFAVTTNVEVEPILSDWIVEAPKTRSAEMVTTDYCYSVRASILDNKRQVLSYLQRNCRRMQRKTMYRFLPPCLSPNMDSVNIMPTRGKISKAILN